MRRIPVRARAAALALGLLTAAPASAHDPYHGLKIPGTGTSCCGGADCAPGEWRLNPETNEEEVRRVGDEAWVRLDYARIVPAADLDGIHVCVRNRRLLCAMLGAGT